MAITLIYRETRESEIIYISTNMFSPGACYSWLSQYVQFVTFLCAKFKNILPIEIKHLLNMRIYVPFVRMKYKKNIHQCSPNLSRLQMLVIRLSTLSVWHIDWPHSYICMALCIFLWLSEYMRSPCKISINYHGTRLIVISQQKNPQIHSWWNKVAYTVFIKYICRFCMIKLPFWFLLTVQNIDVNSIQF